MNGHSREELAREYTDRINLEFENTRKYRDIPLEEFAKLIQKTLELSTRVQNETPRPITIDGLPAYEFTLTEGKKLGAEGVPLKMEYGFWSSFGTHRFILLESPIGEKYYIHYKPLNPISERIFKSFHFKR